MKIAYNFMHETISSGSFTFSQFLIYNFLYTYRLVYTYYMYVIYLFKYLYILDRQDLVESVIECLHYTVNSLPSQLDDNYLKQFLHLVTNTERFPFSHNIKEHIEQIINALVNHTNERSVALDLLCT